MGTKEETKEKFVGLTGMIIGVLILLFIIGAFLDNRIDKLEGEWECMANSTKIVECLEYIPISQAGCTDMINVDFVNSVPEGYICTKVSYLCGKYHLVRNIK